jgi:hypothetical protein
MLKYCKRKEDVLTEAECFFCDEEEIDKNGWYFCRYYGKINDTIS